MNAVVQQVPVWMLVQQAVTDCRKRLTSAEIAELVPTAECARYVLEEGESMTDCLANTLIEMIDDDRSHARMNNVLSMLMGRSSGEIGLPQQSYFTREITESMARHVRARIARRVKRELE